MNNATLIIASNNPGKIREIKAILGSRFAHILSMSEAGLQMDVEETGTTFEENAILKAQAVAQATGMTALADDSGLAVDALGGAPGVYSARYSGGDDQDNNDKLLRELQDHDDRRARYLCVMALAAPQGDVVTAEGRCEGAIAREPKGKRGFGYDPLFLVEGYDGQTMAQLPEEEKNRISHRKRAIEALLQKLEQQP